MQDDALIVESVKKSFGDKRVLQDIYLKAEVGDIVGLLGRNGSGKSTLLKIIFGTLNAESKFIKIGGKIYENAYKHDGIVSLLPQDDFLPKDLRVGDVADIYFGRDKAKIIANDETVERIANAKIKNLSGGELRYLEVKLLANLNAKYLLLDEPFNGLSPIMIEGLKKIILKTASTKGVILSDHDYRSVLSIANKIYVLKDGHVKKIEDEMELIRYGYVPG